MDVCVEVGTITPNVSVGAEDGTVGNGVEEGEQAEMAITIKIRTANVFFIKYLLCDC